MKANEAPKKIYLDPKKVEESEFGIIDAIVPEYRVEKGDIEYICTDAFIEKASRWIEENICEYCEGENIIFTANNTQYIDILNQQQFIEDFKNYLKYGKV